LSFIPSHNILANSVYMMKTKHSKTSTIKSKLDTFTNSSRFDYYICKNQSESTNDNGKIIRCPSNMKLMLKEFQAKPQFLVTKKLNQTNLPTMKPPRCGVIDGPLLYSLESPW
jgi:hypothetical protein